jgi:hypothetical protein
MKALPTVTAVAFGVAVLAVSQSQDDLKLKPKPFIVSKAGKNQNRLMNVFEQVRWKEAGFQYHKLCGVGTYTASEHMAIRPPNKRYNIRGKYWWRDRDKESVIELPIWMSPGSPVDFGDDTAPEFDYYGWIKTEKNVDVLAGADGEIKKLPLWRHMSDLRVKSGFLMTKNEFLSQLKQGKTWKLVIFDSPRCRAHLGKFKNDYSEQVMTITRRCKNCKPKLGGEFVEVRWE